MKNTVGLFTSTKKKMAPVDMPRAFSGETEMKTLDLKAHHTCPCCGQKTIRDFTSTDPKPPPLGFLLRQAWKRQRGEASGRDWRTDPRPHDSIAILNRAYYERPGEGDMQVPIFRRVIRVSKKRLLYQTGDDRPVRSCSRATWRKLDADLVVRAVTNEGKAYQRSSP